MRSRAPVHHGRRQRPPRHYRSTQCLRHTGPVTRIQLALLLAIAGYTLPMPASHSRLRIVAPIGDILPSASWETPTSTETFVCDLCEETFNGKAEGSGLLLWTRGSELRYEEPPLCKNCGDKLLLGALSQWMAVDEGE